MDYRRTQIGFGPALFTPQPEPPPPAWADPSAWGWGAGKNGAASSSDGLFDPPGYWAPDPAAIPPPGGGAPQSAHRSAGEASPLLGGMNTTTVLVGGIAVVGLALLLRLSKRKRQ